IDALDNFESRLLLNKFAVSHKIPLFHGAVWGLEGRATTVLPGKTICLNCIYKEVPPKEIFPVAGVTPAVIGSIQATEVLKYLTGIGELLANRLLIYDGELMEFSQITLHRDPNCLVCGKLTD
ncbi:MAG: HesA/MoeB/ThiF family protein, partial [Candidatus Poribacteria bacterium]